MKSVLFIGTLEFGGAERQMMRVATLMSDCGFDVHFAYAGKEFYSPDILRAKKVHVYKINKNKLLRRQLDVAYRLYQVDRLVLKHKIDVVVAFLREWNFMACMEAKWHKGVRAITGIRNAREEVYQFKDVKFYNKFDKYATYIVSNSHCGKNLYLSHFPEQADKLKVIYNAVEIGEMTDADKAKSDERKKIVVAASYRPVKNPFTLLNAVFMMTEEERNRFVVEWYGNSNNGSNPYYVELAEFVKSNGLQDTIHLNDSTDEIARIMSEADAVALFSTSEGLPNAICEGMMLGKPVIMTRVSDYDVLVDENNGYLCDSESPESIKQALIALSGNSNEDMASKGASSKERAEKLFSCGAVQLQWKQLIQN